MNKKYQMMKEKVGLKNLSLNLHTQLVNYELVNSLYAHLRRPGAVVQKSTTMELELVRRYYPKGTNGELYVNGSLQCYTIELPWKHNLPNVSCIPEGRYRLQKRYSALHGKHLLVEGVPGRTDILVHPANDALRELKGCIAPVSRLTGEGRGIQSRIAAGWIMSLLAEALEREPNFLIIKSIQHDSTRAYAIADTRLF